jgi:magnesium chelatase subunit D
MNFVRSNPGTGISGDGRRVYPFTAILGQETMKLALLLNAVNPAIGGIVVRGQKGTAKSTAARGLRDLLPPLPDGGRPAFVDFPLGATEDMVIGSIDFEAAVKDGAVRFQPGLLARAHRGVLYIDEVNLLDDHLVDSILGAAESGENVVEREGQSLRHASRFILIGTMNPEEGELRPQLLDRFGLAVSIEGETDPALRVELLKRREEFDIRPDAFIARHRAEEAALAARLAAARQRLPEVMIPAHLTAFITEICARNHVAGHRADIVMERAARAFAAWDGRSDVTSDDIVTVAPMVLLHRMRAGEPDIPPPPPPPPPPPEDDQQENPDDQEDRGEDQDQDQDDGRDDPPPPEGDAGEDDQPESEGDEAPPPPPQPEDKDRDDADEAPPDDIQEVGASYAVRKLERPTLDQVLRTGSGRRSRSRSASKQGRYVKSTSRRGRNDLALDATIRAAAPYQKSRRETATQALAVHIADADIREKVRERRVGNFLLFVVDGSGSMGAQRRMVETKAAIMSLLLDAYQKRDKVSMVLFRGREAEVILPPTNSVDRAAKLLADLPVGGRTPLSRGLGAASEVLRQAMRRDPALMPLVIVMTDGRANAAIGDAPPHEEALLAAAVLRERYPTAQFVVVDTEPPGVVRLGLASKLSAALGAAYFKTEDLRAEDLVSLAKEHQAW